jgi:hypothetical protein
MRDRAQLPEMLLRLDRITLPGLLLLALTLSPIIGLLTPYLNLLFVIPLFFIVLLTGRFQEAYRSFTTFALLAVFVVLAIVFAVTADSPGDALKALNFTELLTFGAFTGSFPGMRSRTVPSWSALSPA